MYGFTYITTNLINGMKYVGRRKCDKYGTWKSYLGSGRAFKQALKKYGKENFKREIIAWYETEEELNNAEAKLIEELNAVRDRTYYNLSVGGNVCAGFHIPEESKEIMRRKISASYTDERRKKYSERMKQHNPNADGHIFRGKKLPKEQVEAMRERAKGSPGLKGKDNPMYGKRGEQHPLYGEKSPFAISVRCIETGETFATYKEAGEHFGTSGSQISRCCNGYNKTCMGFHFEKTSQPKIEKKKTKEEKEKIANAITGNNNPMAKPVMCVETGVIYGAAYEAGRAYDICGEAISNCCKGRSHTAAKVHWRYLTKEELNIYRFSKKRDDEYEGYKAE